MVVIITLKWFLQVEFHTLLALAETNVCLEGGERLECGSLWKIVCSNAKYTQFVVNGLKRAKPPVWFFSVGAPMSHLVRNTAQACLCCMSTRDNRPFRVDNHF